jgi:carbamoyltransferase
MLTLGISGLSHQSTAALLKDGEIIAACEEAKLIGRRSPSGVPHKAIEFCLKKEGVQPEDVDAVATDLQPILAGRELSVRGRKLPVAPMQPVFARLAGSRARPELRDLRTLQDSFPRADFVAVDHYYALAAYAYYPSSFERALVLTLDSTLARQAGAIALAEGGRIRQLATARFPHSVGLLYSEVSKLLGWEQVEENHRTAWLSTIGQPEFQLLFRHIFAPLYQGQLRLNTDCFNLSATGRIRLSEKFLVSIGLDAAGRKAREMPQAWRANLAASVQTEAEAALVRLAEVWRERTRTRELCFSGAVAFNALLADALARQTGFDNGFIPPAAGNAGCAIGAAMAAMQSAGIPLRRSMKSAALGPSYSGQQIKDILDNCRLHYMHLSLPQTVETVAQLLAEGLFVGWFQGAAEFGPRALGNRSILAAPRDHWVKENLNAYTKRREAFRPLAASVIEEDAARYFEYRWPDAAGYLATLARVKDPNSIPGLAFQGNRARIQIVTRAANRYYHDLLTRMGQLTGHPILINTSFNEPGAPLAATPGEALRVFYSSGIDVLALGNFLIRK